MSLTLSLPLSHKPARLGLAWLALLGLGTLGGTNLPGSAAGCSMGLGTPAGAPQTKGKAAEEAKASTPVPPPGMVWIPPQQIVLGAPLEELESYLTENPGKAPELAPNIAPEFAGETRRRPKMEVPGFFIQSTEVTNEQYEVFVRATGHRPPYEWGKDAIDNALLALNKEQGKLLDAARAEGKPAPTFPAFDRFDWWTRHFKESEWAVPAGEATLPVVYVDFQDATAYARWAGLRLMTEFEFEAAGGRGLDKDGRRYPWGNEWLDGAATTTEEFRAKGIKGKRLTVPSNLKSVSPFGVFDLSGNVWEWTASPYKALTERWETRMVQLGKRRGDSEVALAPSGMTGFDPDKRVVVGGSYLGTNLQARLTTRRGTLRDQTNEGMGFRCVADANPLATRLLELQGKLPSQVVGVTEFDFLRSGGRYHWNSLSGTVTIPPAPIDGGTGKPVSSSYAVITGVDTFAFVPTGPSPFKQIESLDAASIAEQPVVLGLFSSTVPLAVPALPAGNYVVAYRAAGAAPDKDRQEPREGGDDGASTRLGSSQEEPASPKPTLEQVIDFTTPQFIFYDLEGQPLAGLVAGPVENERSKRAEGVETHLKPYEPPKHAAKEEELPPPHDTASFRIKLLNSSKSEFMIFTLPLEIKKGTLDGWQG